MPSRCLCAVAVALCGATPATAQELEPRALVNAPVGTNFLIASVGYLRGNVLLEPSLPITDGKGEVGTFAVGYLRAIDLAGMAAKVGVIVPTATGSWSGNFGGTDTSTSRTGFGDPLFRLSFNFVGSPALALPEFVKYRQSFVAGANLVVTAPLGQYDSDRLVNLGTNRWSIGPRVGVSQVLGRVVVEGYAAATFYTDNTNFLGGNTLSQDPLLEVQGHLIYLIRREIWTAVSVGYGWGGRTSVNGGPENAPLENARLSAMFRFPLARGHSLKLVYINGLRTALGSDFDTFQVAYQHAWSGKR